MFIMKCVNIGDTLYQLIWYYLHFQIHSVNLLLNDNGIHYTTSLNGNHMNWCCENMPFLVLWCTVTLQNDTQTVNIKAKDVITCKIPESLWGGLTLTRWSCLFH